MSNSTLDDSYEAFAPQWTDFNEITPNRNVEGDEYFDRVHDNLEAMSSKNPEKHRRNLWREKVKTDPSEYSSILLNTPKNMKFQESEIESTFIDDIDKIHMTPIKVTSPRTKNKEPIIMQELSVNEVLSNAMKGLEIATTKSKNSRKTLFNATVCSSSNKNSKTTSSQRKVRVSKSMHSTSLNSPIGKTPIAKVAATPQSINTPKAKVPLIVIESGVRPTQLNDSTARIAVDKKLKNTDSNSSMCGNSAQFKTPNKLSKSKCSTASSTLLSAKKQNDSSKCLVTPKTPKHKLTIETPKTKHVSDNIIVQHNALLKTEIKNECEEINEAADKQIYESSFESQHPNVSTEKTILNLSIEEREDGTASLITDVFQPGEINIKVDKDFPIYGNQDAAEMFKVQRNTHGEHRNYRYEKVTLLTNPARRRSSIFNRRRSNKYISLAEAVSTFQRSTPTRFHTVSSKSGPLQRIKQTSVKCTIPVSPALKSKTRVRRQAVLSQAEREEEELKLMRQHQVHANPIRPGILKAPETLKSVAKKPITVPKPFKLSGKPKPSQQSASCSSDPLHHPTITRSKRVITLAPSEDSQSVEPQEIRNFGIPIMRNLNEKKNDGRKKVTQPQPFTIEERHKQFLNKKEEKLKLLQSEEAKKNKFEFHARPVPSAVKKSSVVNTAKEKCQKVAISHVQVVPFSFDERNRILMKKKEELRKKIEEEERKARIFHANPVPTFKPVIVRSLSRENLRVAKTQSSESVKTDGKNNNIVKSNENLVPLTRGKSVECLEPSLKCNIPNRSIENLNVIKRANSHNNIRSKLSDFKSRTNSVDSINDQENIVPNVQRSKNESTMPALKPKLKPLPIELHSDKRAKIRREYDEKMRTKLEQEEECRRKDEENRLAREKAEIAEIRKKAEIKARPMPAYRPLIPVKSTKPLTEAESPAWAKKKR